MDAKSQLALEIGMLVIRNCELAAASREAVTKIQSLEAEVEKLNASVKVTDLPSNPYDKSHTAENGAMQ